MKHHKPKYRYVSRYRQQSENEQNIQPTSSATEQQTPFQNRFSDSSFGGTCLGEAKIVNQFEAILNSCIDEVVANPEILCRNPGRDFTRNRKISAGSIIKFLITADGKCLKKLTAEFLHMQGIEYTSYQSFGLQRAKLTDTVFPTIFKLVNEKTRFYDTLTYKKGYSLLAVDGTSLSIAYNADGSSYLETKGTNEYIVTALYDVMNKVYVDLDVRYKSKQYEVQSCIQMIGRNAFKPKTILTADRLYSALNLYEHINRKGLFYVIRCKTAKALWEINELEDKEQDVIREIRVHTTQTKEDLLNTKNHISHQLFGESKFGKDNQHITWDFENHYSMKIRFVKFQLDSGEWEVLATNLPASEFSLSELKDLYHLRWEIETSFRSLKYDVGLISLHSRKEEFVIQDIYASFIAYNIGSRIQQIFNRTVIKDPKKAINISQAFYLVRVAFKDKVNPYSDIDTIIARYTIPKRPGRKDKRKEVKPKKVKAFEYRVA